VPARAAVAETVDWPCDVVWDPSDANLGYGRRVATGLDRVFGDVKAAIELEDDWVPAGSFFGFCAELLARYPGRRVGADDQRDQPARQLEARRAKLPLLQPRHVLGVGHLAARPRDRA
jgi:hypothetical protein